MSAHDDDLVVALRRSAHGLVQRDLGDVEDVLTQIVTSAARMVPGADACGLARTDRGATHVGHASDDVVRELDRLQYDLQQGPGVATDAGPAPGSVVAARDLAGDDRDRWPRFAPRAVERGYRSVLATQLATRAAGRHAALTLYSHEPHAFDDRAGVVVGLFAAQVSLALHGAERAAHLERALESRDVIGQAKGILMERFTVSSHGAFRMLVASSQATNLKLAAVARWLVGEADGSEPSPDGTPPTLHRV